LKKNTISADSVIRQSKDIVASDIDDEKVMMSMEKGHYYGLDSIGRSIWDILEKPMTVSQLIDTLRRDYDVDRETCERDVLAFLEALHADGIIHVGGPSSE
jgi:hypothetical protein